MGSDSECAPREVAEETPGGIVSQGPEAIPDGGYGWVCVICVFFLNACTWGIAATYGVFLSHYLTAQTFPSATALDYAFIGGLQFGCSLSLATPVTILTRRFGIYIPMLAGVVVQTAGYILASFASYSSIWQLYLTQGALVGVGIGLAYLPSAVVTSQWFEKKRSLANGIVSAGSGIGGIAFAFATQRVIDSAGLSWALRVIGIVSGAVNLVAVALIRSRNKEVRATIRGFDVALLRRENVLLLLGWAFTSMLGYMTLLYSLSAYGKDYLGLSDSQASAVTAFLNLGTAVGRPTLGWASDRLGRIEVAGMSTAACAVIVFAIWIPSSSYGVLIFFAIISGTILGVLWMTISPLCVEVAGLKDLNSMLSLAWATTVLPCTFSEVIALKIRRPNAERPYLYPQIYSGISYALAAAIMFRLWQVQRRKNVTNN
ncbi:Major facilitator superfamily [Macrophomina phaseolina MS6]|uniref:Major facilitator superfamily n=1 Tax=Macrophomina phaseolina (strain MS6) TaxID=1126212 RepID=K2QZF5_MACPH|nr:Major facilitator superfamily [Macrophomina phaseolina MS6]